MFDEHKVQRVRNECAPFRRVLSRGDERKIRNELFEALEIADESDKGRV